MKKKKCTHRKRRRKSVLAKGAKTLVKTAFVVGTIAVATSLFKK